jgi:hypothetical protein
MTDDEERRWLSATAYARVRAAETLLREALGDLEAAGKNDLASRARDAVRHSVFVAERLLAEHGP